VVRHADTQSGLLNQSAIEERIAAEKALEVRAWPMEMK
jgi:hypothetical protein